jgi:PilZ domain
MTGQKPREHNRYNVQALARVKKVGSDDWLDVKVVTISSMGACFETTGKLSVADALEFYMAAPNASSKPFHLSARIVWIKESQVGIEFTGNLATS